MPFTIRHDHPSHLVKIDAVSETTTTLEKGDSSKNSVQTPVPLNSLPLAGSCFLRPEWHGTMGLRYRDAMDRRYGAQSHRTPGHGEPIAE